MHQSHDSTLHLGNENLESKVFSKNLVGKLTFSKESSNSSPAPLCCSSNCFWFWCRCHKNLLKSKFGFTFQVFEVSCKVLFYCIFWLQISVTVYTKVTCLKLCSFHKITTCGQDQARPETAWETFQFGVALLSRVHKKLFFSRLASGLRKSHQPPPHPVMGQ